MAKLRRNPLRQTSKPQQEGRRFESSVAEFLERELNNSYEVLTNVIIDNTDDIHDRFGAATRREIDHIVVGPNGVFLLEDKSYAGRVEGLLWGFWHLTSLSRDKRRDDYQRATERKEAVALEGRMYRVTALIDRFIRREGLHHLKPYTKVRGIFVFPDSAEVDLRAMDGTPIHPQADVRPVNVAGLVQSIEEALPPRGAAPLPHNLIRRLSELLDRGLCVTPDLPATTYRVIGQFKLEEELARDRAPNGLSYTLYKLRDVNTNIVRRGKYYDWSPVEKKLREQWVDLIRRHQTVLSTIAPNRYITPIITALTDEENYGYMVVEHWTDGQSLSEVLNSPSALSRLDPLRFMLDLALGVLLVHRHNFIHRELNPTSVFVNLKTCDAIISNFELAKMRCSGEAEHAGEIPTVFTRHVAFNSYRAPELFISPHDVDERADIFSWGAIFFRLATGHPFKNEVAAFDDLLTTDLADDVKLLIGKCLEADPKDRPTHMGEIIAMLGQFVGSGV